MLPTQADVLATRDPLLQDVFFPPEVVDEVTQFMKAPTDPAARNSAGSCRAGCRVG